MKKAVHRLSKIEIDSREKDIAERMKMDDFDINTIDQSIPLNDPSMMVPVNSILVMNKVDLVSNRRRFNYMKQELEDIGKFDYVFNLSAKTGFGLQELTEYIVSQARRGEWEVHPKMNSKMNEIDKVQEIMKQAVYKNYFYEIPYQVGIECTAWVPKTNGELLIDYKLSVPRRSIKGIIIGKKGRIIRGLREEVQAELSRIYQKPVVV